MLNFVSGIDSRSGDGFRSVGARQQSGGPGRRPRGILGPNFTWVPAMTLGTVWPEALSKRCDATRRLLVGGTPWLNTTLRLVIVTAKVFGKIPDAPFFGFARPRDRATLKPCGTSVSVFTRVWVCVATIEPQYAAIFEPLAKVIESPCSIWVNAIVTVTGSELMFANRCIGFVAQRGPVTAARARHCENSGRGRSDERANNRLKQTARGRLGAESLRRTRAAA